MKTYDEFRSFVNNLVASQLGITPDKITDETIVPDSHELFTQGAIILETSAVVNLAKTCTVRDAIERLWACSLPHFYAGDPSAYFNNCP